MKKATKILVIALAVILVVSAVCVLAACGKEEVYEGECSYTVTDYNTTYGAKVKVYVNGNTITKVELLPDSETGWRRTTPSWDKNAESANPGDLGYQDAEKAYPDYLKKFEGKSVDEVKAIQVKVLSGNVSAADSYTVSVTDKTGWWNLTGATQSSARIIAAVQNALSKIGK